jgi:TRAP-type C4-dicarboxylate transport system substrate-binding protein
MNTKTSIAFRLTALTVMSAAVATSGPAQAQDKPVELRFAHWLPAQHSLAKTGFEPWAKAVEAASGGSIKVTLYPAQQLGKAPDHYDMARDGIADMTWVSPGYQAGRFPVFAASELPFMMANPGGGSAALGRLVPQAGWHRDEGRASCAWPTSTTARCTARSSSPSPGQIKGMKIRPANGTVAQMVTLLGGTNVQVSAPESRDALEKGVADAITFPWDSLISFGIDKVAKQHIDFSLYAASFVWVLNKGFYDKLGAGQKKVIDAHCSNEWAAKVGAAWGDWEDSGEGKIEKMGGHTITKLTPPQLDAWRQAVAPMTAQWIATPTRPAPTAVRCWTTCAPSSRRATPPTDASTGAWR